MSQYVVQTYFRQNQGRSIWLTYSNQSNLGNIRIGTYWLMGWYLRWEILARTIAGWSSCAYGGDIHQPLEYYLSGDVLVPGSEYLLAPLRLTHFKDKRP